MGPLVPTSARIIQGLDPRHDSHPAAPPVAQLSLLLGGWAVYQPNKPAWGDPRLSRGNAVKTASERRAAMSWAQRLKRVLRVDIETCRHCNGSVKVIASIEDPGVVKQILDHLDQRARPPPPISGSHARAPPPGELPGFEG